MSDNRDVQRAAGQEIPDRRTTQAAAWLTEHAATLSTPEFWMIAGLLGMYGEKIATQVREQTVAECLASLDGDTYPVMVLAAVNLMRKRIQAIAAPPETTEQEER